MDSASRADRWLREAFFISWPVFRDVPCSRPIASAFQTLARFGGRVRNVLPKARKYLAGFVRMPASRTADMVNDPSCVAVGSKPGAIRAASAWESWQSRCAVSGAFPTLLSLIVRRGPFAIRRSRRHSRRVGCREIGGGSSAGVKAPNRPRTSGPCTKVPTPDPHPLVLIFQMTHHDGAAGHRRQGRGNPCARRGPACLRQVPQGAAPDR